MRGWVIIYVVGYVVTYLLTVRVMVKFQSQEGTVSPWEVDDTVLVLGVSFLISMVWPLLVPLYLLVTFAHRHLVKLAEPHQDWKE